MSTRALLLFAGLLLVPLRAGAEAEVAPEPPAVPPEVVQHDEAAVVLFARGDYEAALAELRAAEALLPSAPRLYNIAACLQELGDLAGAIEHYERFVAAEDAPEDRRAEAREQIARLRAALARVEARTGGAGAGTPPGEGPPPGDEPVGGPGAGEGPRPEPGPPPSAGLDPAAFWTMLGVTAAVGLATAVVGGVALERHDRFLSSCADPALREELRDEGRALALATDVLLGVMAAAAATAVVLALVTRWHRSGGALAVTAGPGGVTAAFAFR